MIEFPLITLTGSIQPSARPRKDDRADEPLPSS
jgi:hypothetical protein